MAEKQIKLKDLLKGSGFEEIPTKWFNPESGETEKGEAKSIDMVFGEKEVILKATVGEGEADRGLIIKHTNKGCQVQYWYETPNNIVPVDLTADGTSKGKSIKKITLGHTPEKD
tara:strand:- start:190 stop:531 length:342 start_codon:yes stop_codon:yes gene_type:complete